MFESENEKLSNQNRKTETGIIEAEIRIEATQLTRRIVTALPRGAWIILREVHVFKLDHVGLRQSTLYYQSGGVVVDSRMR